MNVNESLSDDGISKIYSITFHSDLGNVDLIEEIAGYVNASISEITPGYSNGQNLQLNIENSTTSLFNLNSTEKTV